MLLRNIGYTEIQSVKDVFGETLSKEINAAVESYRPVVLRWDCLLSPSKKVRMAQTLGADYPLNPMVNNYIFSRLSSVRSSLTRRIFYPDIGQKTVGKEAKQEIDRQFKERDLPKTHTLLDCEMLYHKEGIILPGATELRWAWKYNDLKPRVYYARGPSVYYASRYIQAVFNVILEAFPQVSKFERFSTSSIRIPETSRFFVYDYSSFTSTLEEIKSFLLNLADFYRGTEIQIVDTFHGLIRKDLGELLDEYNEVCSFYPEFDVSEISWDKIKEEGPAEILNHTCGMLGVPGNISSCTLLHGLHLMLVLESLDCKCVGDDAAGVDDKDNQEWVDSNLSNIGKLETSKVENWRNDEPVMERGDYHMGWNYIKRPIDRVDTRIHIGEQLVWPPICVMLQLTDKYHTQTRAMDSKQAYVKGCTMLRSFIVSLRSMPQKANEMEQEVITRYYHAVWRLLVKKFGTHNVNCMMPTDPWVALDIDAWLFQFRDKVIPHRALFKGGEQEVVKSEVISLTQSPALSLARKLGYATVDPIIELHRVGSEPEIFRDLLLRESKSSFLYTVVIDDSIPAWLFKLVCSSYELDDNYQPFHVEYPDVDPFSVLEDDWE
jgi:hypothetical protein